MDLLRRAAAGSWVVRQALVFLAFAAIADLLMSVLTGSPWIFFMFCAFAYLGVLLAGFAQGAKWVRDPDIPTRGRAPDVPAADGAGASRVTSRTVRLPLDPSLRAVLIDDARGRTREARAWVVTGSAFVLGGAFFVAMQAADALLFAAAILITFVPAAFIWVLAGTGTSADAERAEMDRTEGRVRLSWAITRGGRLWTFRVGDRTLHVWDDDVGLQLANMPWGVTDYTVSGRILRVRDIDGNPIYELEPRKETAAVRAATWLGPLLLAGWVILGLFVRLVR